VVTHEFGHYLQSAFSRNDSIGGAHTGSDQLDMRVAFSEGFGNGWSGYALTNKTYADTALAGQAGGFSFDISAGTASNPGWFREASLQKIFWDLSTSTTIGFGPVWTALKTGVTATPALTSAHSFAYALKLALPAGSQSALSNIFNNQSIAIPTDTYGTGETNFGSPTIANLNPIYQPYGAPVSTNLCVSNSLDTGATGMSGNKLNEVRYVTLSLATAGTATFQVTRNATTLAATDPDFRVYGANGLVLSKSTPAANSEIGTATLPSGNYVVAVTDYTFRTTNSARTSCFDLTIN
jgi:hypothetical protein